MTDAAHPELPPARGPARVERPVGPADFRNLVQMFRARVRQFGDAPLLHTPATRGWQATSWNQMDALVARVAAGLRAHGVRRGDRVALIAENRLEWYATDLAVLTLGAITVPGYTTSTAEDWLYLLEDSGARVALASGAVWQRMARAEAQFRQRLDALVLFDGGGPAWARDWQGLQCEAVPADFDADAEASQPDDTACIIYTSGTGGKPRGVQTTHRNILSNCLGAGIHLAGYGMDGIRFLSFLPLSHTYEHTAGFHFPISLGAQIFVSRGTDHLAVEMQTARPTVMTAVPRFCEVMYQRIRAALARESRVKRALFAMALRTGTRRLYGPPPGLLDRILDRIAEVTVRAKVRRRFGGELRCMLSAGAPIAPEITIFFTSLGIRLHQAYGQTECAPGITMNPPGDIRPGSVGPAMAGMEVRIAADGEILVRGPSVMKGYWNDPQATAAALADGWLHTGDVGVLDADGQLRITDRMRDFIKTAGGEMVAPQAVEQVLGLQPAVGQALVCGNARPYLTALIVPHEELLAEQAAGRCSAAAVQASVEQAVAEANHALPAHMRVRRFALMEKPFDIDSGTLTPTLKIRRRIVEQACAARIDALYARG